MDGGLFSKISYLTGLIGDLIGEPIAHQTKKQSNNPIKHLPATHLTWRFIGVAIYKIIQLLLLLVDP